MFLRRLREYLKFLRSLFKMNVRIIWGMWRLTKLPHPAITVFGGSRVAHGSIHAQMAEKLGKLLASDGFSIITGGGPGIMEAANQGAIEYLKECNLDNNRCVNKVVSAGIGLLRLNVEHTNPYLQENIVMTHFFARKWLLVRYSVGFVVFPGGFGTLDELFEIVTLVQCNKMAKVPIILVDRGYWQPLIDWIEHRPLTYGLIEKPDTQIITVVDTAEDAFAKINELCKGVKESVLVNGSNKD